ncbi:MAG: CapA family protein [Betaproteobacteria bacterium]|nr:CapA family protein [Betaproteobacteria bacterium]
MQDREDAVSLYAVGDVCVNREMPESIFSLSAPVLNEADIAFCQLETVYSERGTPSVVVGRPLRAHPRNVSAFAFAGFDIVSLAGNHVMDFGAEALADTKELFESRNICTVGAGRNISEARKPVFMERKGVRIAFLAYNSVLPYRHWAEADKPGCAPVRVSTFYEQLEPHEPGGPARVITVTDKGDLEAMKQDIVKAKASADAVVLSLHWGLHFTPAVIAGYQGEVGRAAIDAGADLIIGTHAHILKGIEVYRGKVITYCLCNFAFDNGWTAEEFAKPRHRERQKYYPNFVYDKNYPTYTFPVDSRKTAVLKCSITKAGVQRVSLLPAYINSDGQPEILARSDPRSAEVFNYMDDLCREFNTKLSFDGDEVLIHTG